jgi:hypothetical protein
VKGITLNLAFQALGFVIAMGMTAYYRWENRRRDREEGGPPAEGAVLNTMEEFDLAPGKPRQVLFSVSAVTDWFATPRFPLRRLVLEFRSLQFGKLQLQSTT